MPNPAYHIWRDLRADFATNLADRAAELRSTLDTQLPVSLNDDTTTVFDRMVKCRQMLADALQPVSDTHFFARLETVFAFNLVEIVAIKRGTGDFQSKMAAIRSHLRQATSVYHSKEHAKRAFQWWRPCD